MKEYDSLSDNEKRKMLASVANLYYNAEMTQNQIAERFFTSRSKISRMLKEARQLGIEDLKTQRMSSVSQYLNYVSKMLICNSVSCMR